MGHNYRRGAAREREYAERLQAKGWEVVRSAGSRSPMDLVALKEGHAPRFIQVKSDRAGAYAHFGPKDRAELRASATRAGAVAELIWWPADRGGPRIIPADAWPA